MIKLTRRQFKGFTHAFFTVSNKTQVKNQQLLSLLDGDSSEITTCLKKVDNRMDPVNIMVYNTTYSQYERFPIEAILQILVLWSLMITAIVLSINTGNIIYVD